MPDRNYTLYVIIGLLIVTVAVLSYQFFASAHQQVDAQIGIRHNEIDIADVEWLAGILSEPNSETAQT